MFTNPLVFDRLGTLLAGVTLGLLIELAFHRRKRRWLLGAVLGDLRLDLVFLAVAALVFTEPAIPFGVLLTSAWFNLRRANARVDTLVERVYADGAHGRATFP